MSLDEKNRCPATINNPNPPWQCIKPIDHEGHCNMGTKESPFMIYKPKRLRREKKEVK